MENFETILHNSVSEIQSSNNLVKRLESGKKLVIKLGVDPTSPDLHLGHAVVLRKLKEFADLGHKIVLIIGDFTALIGDPSGVNSTRPQLSEDDIDDNIKTYLHQVGKVLDLQKTKIVRNSEWLSKMSVKDYLQKYGMNITMNTILEREDFKKRFADGQSVRFHEINYPIMQAIDSVELKADVEVGGWDQKLNLLLARELQKKMGQEPQDIIMIKLIRGTDGTRKMSKSYGNTIGLRDNPNLMFGKVMSIPDDLLEEYAELAGNYNEEEIKELKKLHPMEAKLDLAEKITQIYWGEDAKKARNAFEKTFRDKTPDEEVIQKVKISKKEISTVDLVVELTQESRSQAMRLIEQGAVTIGDQKAGSSFDIVKISKGTIVKVGRKSFFEII